MISNCQTCKHNGEVGASYEMDKCYGCNEPKLNNYKSNTKKQDQDQEFITKKEMEL